MKRIIILLGIIVSACTPNTITPPTRIVPVVRPIDVNIPVPVNCVPEITERPDYPDDDLSDLDLENPAAIQLGVNRLLSGRLLRDQEERELRAAISGCSG